VLFAIGALSNCEFVLSGVYVCRVWHVGYDWIL
jgi:hypothetical protein